MKCSLGPRVAGATPATAPEPGALPSGRTATATGHGYCAGAGVEMAGAATLGVEGLTAWPPPILLP